MPKKIYLGSCRRPKAPCSHGTFASATPQVLYWGIHFCKRSVSAISSVIRCNYTL